MDVPTTIVTLEFVIPTTSPAGMRAQADILRHTAESHPSATHAALLRCTATAWEEAARADERGPEFTPEERRARPSRPFARDHSFTAEQIEFIKARDLAEAEAPRESGEA